MGASLKKLRRWLVLVAWVTACSRPEAAPSAPERGAPRERHAQVASPAAWAPCACEQRSPTKATAALLTHGPVLGALSDRSVKIWVRSEKASHFVVRMALADGSEPPRCTAPAAIDRAADFTGVVALDALEPAATYAYSIEAIVNAGDCGRAATAPTTFHTLGEAGKPTRVRFAVGADVRGSKVPGFADIAKVAPDFVLMIGDNVYADDDGWVAGDYDATYARYQRLYQRVWGGPQFRKLFSTTPTFMTWDDHEIMENYWAGKNDLRYAVARALFDSYQGNHNPDPIHRGELYYSFKAGDIGFFVLDVRTHRDGNELKERKDPTKTMLGAAQREALLRWLANDPSRVHVLISPVIMSTFRTTGADPWRAFDAERTAVLEAIAANSKTSTFIISGDQHWSAVLRLDHDANIPHGLYEFQTTPLGSGLRAAPERPGVSMIALDNKHRVFGLFELDTRVDPPRLTFTMCAVGKPCNPGREPAPESTGPQSAKLPYTVHFEAMNHGFAIVASD